MIPIIPFLISAAKTLGSAALAGGKTAGTAALSGASKLPGLVQMGTGKVLSGASQVPGLVSSGIQKGGDVIGRRVIGQSMNLGPTQPSLGLGSLGSKLGTLSKTGLDKVQSLMPQRLIGQSMDVGPTQPSLINTKNALRLGKFLYDQNVANAQTPTYQPQIYQPQIRRSNLQDIINRYS